MLREWDENGEVSVGTSVLQSNHPGPGITADEGRWLVENCRLAGGGNDEAKNNGEHRKPSYLRPLSFSLSQHEQGSDVFSHNKDEDNITH